MKEWFKQKPLIIAGLVLLLAVAAYANLRGLTPESDTPAGASPAGGGQIAAVRTTKPAASATPSSEPASAEAAGAAQSSGKYSQLRAERTASREDLIAQLDALITRQGTDKEVRKQAEQERIALIKWMDAELAIEDALKAMQYAGVLATVRDGSVNVVIQSSTPLDQEAATRILDICVRETGFPASEVKISAAK